MSGCFRKLVLLPGELAGGRHAVRTEDSELAQASILRRVFEQGVIEAQEKAGLQWRFGDFRALPGAELIPHTIAKLDRLLQELGV